jgi:membrane protein YdbS with pleckstrin-like domain
MPDPFLFIVGLIAIACVVLFPIRLWRRRRHRYDTEDDAAD